MESTTEKKERLSKIEQENKRFKERNKALVKTNKKFIGIEKELETEKAANVRNQDFIGKLREEVKIKTARIDELRKANFELSNNK